MTVSPELSTVQNYLDKARDALQDLVEPFRYDDEYLVGNLNTALLESRLVRPDLFLAYFGTTLPAYDTTNMSTTQVAFDPMYRMGLVYHMIGYAQLQDNEAVNDERGMTFMQRWKLMLIAPLGA